jgi:hypothetical protein
LEASLDLSTTDILSNRNFRSPGTRDSVSPTSWPDLTLPSTTIEDGFRAALELLHSYSALHDNWDADRAVGITHEAVSAGKILLNTFGRLGILPELSPLRNGGVLFERDDADFGLAIEISPSGIGRLLLSTPLDDYESPLMPALAISAAITRLFQAAT